jgi:hypothetical protein
VANSSYLAYRTAIMTGAINLSTAVIKVALVRSYTFSAAHVFMSDVTGAGGIVNASSAALTTKTITGGIFDADDTAIVATASTANHILIVYQASAVTGGSDVAASAQRLMFYIDTGTNMPITPAAGAVSITWPSATSKIYQLGS